MSDDAAADHGDDAGRASAGQPVGGSAFQWNAGAWFGSQIGSAIWLLAGAVVLFSAAAPGSPAPPGPPGTPGPPVAAAVWLASFLLSLCVTFYLWSQRSRIPAYAAYQRSLLVITIVATASIVAAHVSGQLPGLLGASGGPGPLGAWGSTTIIAAYAALLVFPTLMLRFYVKEQRARISAPASGAEA